VTWDRGTEMASHRNFSIATDVQVYFCDPHSPRQRVSNENTNGLLRRPASDLAIYEPAEKLAETLGVASTG
jgi:IS30 family transposase